MERWATFDCYGTLIDWDGGIRAELVRVFGEERADEQLARYHEVEPELAARRHPQLSRGAHRGDAPHSARRRERSTAWPTRCRAGARSPRCATRSRSCARRGWKLAILSNTDDDLIAASQVRIGVPFDEVVVAQEIGSYKPAHRHWEEFFARTRAPREGHVHVGRSRSSTTSRPRTSWACAASGSTGSARRRTTARGPTASSTDLVALPETLDELVSA